MRYEDWEEIPVRKVKTSMTTPDGGGVEKTTMEVLDLALGLLGPEEILDVTKRVRMRKNVRG